MKPQIALQTFSLSLSIFLFLLHVTMLLYRIIDIASNIQSKRIITLRLPHLHRALLLKLGTDANFHFVKIFK